MIFRIIVIAITLSITLFSTVFAQTSKSQYNRMGNLSLTAGGGVAYYMGDISRSGGAGSLNLGPTVNIGALYRVTDRLSARGDFRIYHVSGSSVNTNYPDKNLTFKTTNPDITLAVQAHLIPTYKEPLVNPYAVLGLGVTFLNPKAEWAGETYKLAKYDTEGINYWRLPLLVTGGIGALVNISSQWAAGLELNGNYLFSDYLDDISTVYPDPVNMSNIAYDLSYRGNTQALPGYTRGNPNSKDMYATFTVRVQYKLPSARAKREKRSLRCP